MLDKHKSGCYEDIRMSIIHIFQSFILLVKHVPVQPGQRIKALSFRVQVLLEYFEYDGAGLGGSVGCAVQLETRRSRVQPPPRSATFFRGD